ERDHSVAAMISPRRRFAVAQADRDDRKRWNLFRPWRAAVADDDEKIDGCEPPLDERAQPDTQVRAAAAVQLDLSTRECLAHVMHRRVAARDHDICAVSELARQPAQL